MNWNKIRVVLFILFTANVAEVNASISVVGSVIFVIGKVDKESPQGEKIAVRKGTIFNVGDKVITHSRGQVMIRTLDKGKLTIRPKSELLIEAFHFEGSSKQNKAFYNLTKGSLRVLTGVIGKGNPKAFKLQSPVATIGIRGTDFGVSYCETECDGSTGFFVSVISGGVSLGNDQDTIILGAGEHGHVENDLESPEPLDSSPDNLYFKKEKTESYPGHEEEFAAVALKNSESNYTSTVQELLTIGIEEGDIVEGGRLINIHEVELIEPILEYRGSSSTINKLLKNSPEQAASILTIGISRDLITTGQAQEIAEKNNLTQQQLESAIALGNLISPVLDEQNEPERTQESGLQDSDRVIQPRTTVPDPLSLPVEGNGGGEAASPS